MRRKIIRCFSVILFLVGCGIFLYPAISEWYAARQSAQVMKEFKEDLERMKQMTTQNADGDADGDAKASTTGSENGVGGEQLNVLYQDMLAYNERLFTEGQKELKDPFSYEAPSFQLKDYGFKNNVIGIITIPAMEVELPLYLGANDSNMAKGAVVLGETSMPTGGIHTNVVVAAHRGYKGIKMFRDIEKLEIGDEIQVTTPWNTLYYEVSEIKIVLPNEISEVLIQPGQDMITLLTCHPYTKNTHRYLVFATRCGEVSSGSNSNSVQTSELGSETGSSEGVSSGSETNLSEILGDDSQTRIWLETYLPYIGGVLVVIVAIVCMILTREKNDCR